MKELKAIIFFYNYYDIKIFSFEYVAKASLMDKTCLKIPYHKDSSWFLDIFY